MPQIPLAPFAPVVRVLFPALHAIHEVRPAARLDTGLMAASGWRCGMRFGERGRRRSIDPQTHPVLVYGGDTAG